MTVNQGRSQEGLGTPLKILSRVLAAVQNFWGGVPRPSWLRPCSEQNISNGFSFTTVFGEFLMIE